MQKESQVSNLIKLSNNTNLSVTQTPGMESGSQNSNSRHVSVAKGTQYTLTDAATGRVIHPRKIARVNKSLEITLLDGTVLQLDDFFISLPGQEGMLQAQADFVFSTQEGGLQYWNIADVITSLNSGLGESVTLWSDSWAMNTAQWPAVPSSVKLIYRMSVELDATEFETKAEPVFTARLSANAVNVVCTPPKLELRSSEAGATWSVMLTVKLWLFVRLPSDKLKVNVSEAVPSRCR